MLKRAFIQVFSLVNTLLEGKNQKIFSFNNIARDSGSRIVTPCTNLFKGALKITLNQVHKYLTFESRM
ncbi:hypothetical protein QVD17_20163 [Tagetes erecta]|uniref:Uncharacterized protein n=1 Tax=Tagetes erecta TaxID=13708 RepID=A0AAD8KSC8_TARER|nr:hypothetical protein QVD17_20163 [Tagetes erecta]